MSITKTLKAMKPLAFALLMLAALPSLAQDQFFTIKAGPVYSRIDGVDADFRNALGYVIGFGVQERIARVLGFGFDLNFLNQRYGIDEVSLSVRSINATLYPQFHVNDNLFFLAGLESGIVTSVRVEDETASGDLEYRFGYVLGVSHTISERWDGYLRYVAPFDHKQTGFDFNVQLGVTFKIRTR